MFTTKRVRIRAMTQLAGGALGAVALTTVLAAGGLTWANNQIGTAVRVASFGPNANVTVIDPNNQPAPEMVDWSTVHVVEITDPATGKSLWQEPK